MKKFKRRGGVVSSHLSEYEISLLTNLIDQLIGMVSEGQPEPDPEDDTFEALVKGLDEKPDPPQDPVLRRLFPDAYRDDPEASSEFRRYTQRDLGTKKVAEALAVRAGLEQTEGGAYEVRIPVDQADVWLRTLTSLRLAVAIRLGVTDTDTAEELADLPEDDPRAFMASVYEWLGFAEETLVSAL
jgi:Domain of unknown function (DUF2017)